MRVASYVTVFVLGAVAMLSGTVIAEGALARPYDAREPAVVRIAAQRLDDGRIEVSLEERGPDGKWGEPIAPVRRFYPRRGRESPAGDLARDARAGPDRLRVREVGVTRRDPFGEGLLKEGVEVSACRRRRYRQDRTARLHQRHHRIRGAWLPHEQATKSLMRMFGPSGNPHARNLFEVISRIQQHEGVQLEVNAVR